MDTVKEVNAEPVLVKESTPEHTSLEELEVIVVAETMEREAKKVCCTVADDTRKVCGHCLRSWSLCLNGCKYGLDGLSFCCLGMSKFAVSVKNFLEFIDCDGQ
jgi:hypothetical protein